MKRSILVCFLFAIITFTSCSDNKISEDKVPAPVVANFKARYPGATDTKGITEKSEGKIVYEAQFKENGQEIEAEFNEDGTFKKED